MVCRRGKEHFPVSPGSTVKSSDWQIGILGNISKQGLVPALDEVVTAPPLAHRSQGRYKRLGMTLEVTPSDSSFLLPPLSISNRKIARPIRDPSNFYLVSLILPKKQDGFSYAKKKKPITFLPH